MTKTESILSRDNKTILEELGIAGLSENDEKEVVEKLLDHFNKVIIETAVLSLNEKEIADFRAALEAKNPEEEISAITAKIPGLADKIEEAVRNEFLVLKTANEKLKG